MRNLLKRIFKLPEKVKTRMLFYGKVTSIEDGPEIKEYKRADAYQDIYTDPYINDQVKRGPFV